MDARGVSYFAVGVCWLSLGCATAIPLPDVDDAERIGVEREIARASLVEIDHEKNLRYWEIALSDEGTRAALTEEVRQVLDATDPRVAAEAVHTEFVASYGIDAASVMRVSPRFIRHLASSDPMSASAFYDVATTVDELQHVVNKRIALVGSRVLASAGRTNVTIVADPEVGLNAFVPVKFGADHIYVGTELALSTASDDELACAIGHEVAHLTEGHTTSGAWVNVGKSTLSVAATIAVAAAMVRANRGQSLSQDQTFAALQAGQFVGFVLSDVPLRLGGWFRGQEREADAVGLYYAWKSGYKPEACANLILGMARNAAAQGQLEGAWWWNVHPVSAERVVLLRKLADEAHAGTLPAPR